MKNKLSLVVTGRDGTVTRHKAQDVRREQVRALVLSFRLHQDEGRLVEEIANTFERWDKGEAQLVGRAANQARWKDHGPDADVVDVLTQAHLLLSVKGEPTGAQRLFKAADALCKDRGEQIDDEKSVRARLSEYQAKEFLKRLREAHAANAEHSPG